jgi:4-hydroxythreonine-4-phosphate dehydrogenase
MASPRRILITTGDPDGIGWEVTAKALQILGPKKDVQFFFYRDPRHAKDKPIVPKKFKHLVVSSLEQAQSAPFDSKTLVEIRSGKSPAVWVEEAARACYKKLFAAMVTAPISKTLIVEAGLHDIGHTEILARVSGQRNLFQGFIGGKFSVLLLTGHFALRDALKHISVGTLKTAIQAGLEMRELLPKAKRKLPLALVGLNPHAGEKGLLGGEEAWMRGVLEEVNREQMLVAGPLVPDAAFLPQNWNKYSVYLTPYHDQGLIPFKMVHGFKGGVHLTLGLPFVRTSVDHGTAKELFGKNKAESGSMKDAITTALKLTE